MPIFSRENLATGGETTPRISLFTSAISCFFSTSDGLVLSIRNCHRICLSVKKYRKNLEYKVKGEF